jgi:hypothetical protein
MQSYLPIYVYYCGSILLPDHGSRDPDGFKGGRP